MEEEINLVELFKTLKKRAAFLINTVLVCILISAFYTFFITTAQYNSTTQILVNRTQTTELIQRSDIDTNVQLINTYKDIISGPIILDEVRENLDSTISHGELRDRISITSEDNSQVFSITVTDESPYNAANIANSIASVFQENLNDIMNVDNVTIISEAIPNMTPTSPNHTINLMVGIFAGLILGLLLIFLLEFLDNTVKEEKFIIEELKWTNLGRVSEMSEDELENETRQPIKQPKIESRSARYRV